ncbi:MAG: FMN-dependent NADH-azoreductase [Eubacteriaceae bacterium]|jgi:FMN-dependent NADH-azoreductase|nr:FMN-dependent NADH-azoreductase [Eubacteriaceae bacterium]MDK2904358.1 FMN-dependent NADH-azoreductase [Eubacteriaceae bacterium]MDK2934996.1 FMN-dependent NADH-azoreductase [Eubacteriaceae bacterium]
MKNLLLIDACIRGEQSRTRKICNALIKNLCDQEVYQLETVYLEKEQNQFLDASRLDLRTRLIEQNDFSDEIFAAAKKFAAADLIVVGAPYWDLSFPAVLKNYFELVSACGVTFCYGADGIPQGLCLAEKLYYVTTSGGFIGDFDFGSDYVKGLCMLYGIKEVEIVKAEGLDIEGLDEEATILQTINALNEKAERI